ncbi:MAG: hypothetical protein ACI4KR_12255, partial [Ruminiclostridium sp.]
MYRGYNLELDKSYFSDYARLVEVGKEQLKSDKNYMRKQLSDYLYNDKSVDGTKLMEDWFPEAKADVFISHSHNDEELANALAGWLSETFGLKSFIDSNIWGYSAALLESINSKYSNKRSDDNGGYLYEHSKCNLASQHVNIMLSTALQNMIYKTECIIFLNTNNSVNQRVYDSDCINETHSPWIYSEILCSKLVRIIVPSRYKELELRHTLYEQASLQKALDISYKLPLDHLTKIFT